MFDVGVEYNLHPADVPDPRSYPVCVRSAVWVSALGPTLSSVSRAVIG